MVCVAASCGSFGAGGAPEDWNINVNSPGGWAGLGLVGAGCGGWAPVPTNIRVNSPGSEPAEVGGAAGFGAACVALDGTGGAGAGVPGCIAGTLHVPA